MLVRREGNAPLVLEGDEGEALGLHLLLLLAPARSGGVRTPQAAGSAR